MSALEQFASTPRRRRGEPSPAHQVKSYGPWRVGQRVVVQRKSDHQTRWVYGRSLPTITGTISAIILPDVGWRFVTVVDECDAAHAAAFEEIT